MPTVKPRFAVTCEPETHEVIQRLADLQGRSRGAIVAELLDEIAPALSRTVALLEAAAAAPQKVKDGLRDIVEDVHNELLQVSGDSILQMDMLLSALRDGANPHVVTRGSGSGEHHRLSTHKSSQNPSKSGVTGKSPNSKSCGSGYARKGR